MIKTYLRKPVPVEAVQWNGYNEYELMELAGDAVEIRGKVYIHTREGILQARVGDYIVKGPHGSIYPCGKKAFEELYSEKLQ